MRFRLVLIGFALGLLLAGACGPTSQGTSLFVRVFFTPSLGTRALTFTGVNASGNEVFPRSQRPETFDGGALTSPQTVRVLLVDSLAGKPLTLVVAGINSTNEAVEGVEVTVVPVVNVETDVEVSLEPFAAADAGVDAGTDAGGGVFLRDGGLIDGGTCSCDGGCCSASTSQCAPTQQVTFPGVSVVTLVPCGARGQYCAGFCNPATADRCNANGNCRCGLGPECNGGQRCALDGGVMTCVCDSLSRCSGCCDRTNCVANTPATCGAAGQQCDKCALPVCDTGACGLCAIGNDPGLCCTGNHRMSVGFPICRASNGVCFACDPYRSNRCNSQYGLCDCGSHRGPCQGSEVCVRSATDAGCVAVPARLP